MNLLKILNYFGIRRSDKKVINDRYTESNVKKDDDDCQKRHHILMISKVRHDSLLNFSDLQYDDFIKISEELFFMFIISMQMYPMSELYLLELDAIGDIYLEGHENFRILFTKYISDLEQEVLKDNQVKEALEMFHLEIFAAEIAVEMKRLHPA